MQEKVAATESAWIQQRRGDVKPQHADARISSLSSIKSRAHALVGGAFDHGHVMEDVFQRVKHNKRFLEALHDGHLLPEEHTDEHVNLAKAQEYFRVENQDERLKKDKKNCARLVSKTPDLSGLTVYFDDRVQSDGVRPAMTKEGMTITVDILAAHIFVTMDPSNAPDRVIAAAALTGGRICTQQFLLRSGLGSSFKYNMALSTRRCLWMSDAYKSTYPRMTDLLQRACGLPDSRWSLLSSEHVFLQCTYDNTVKKGSKRLWRLLDQIALVTKHERKTQKDSLTIFC